MPDILEAQQRDGSWRFELRVPPDCRFFIGHFPGLPVLPGVVQLHWVLLLYRQHSGDLRAVRGLRRLKFQRIIRPGDVLQLECRLEASDKLAFAYNTSAPDAETGAMSSGLCLLGRGPTARLQ